MPKNKEGVIFAINRSKRWVKICGSRFSSGWKCDMLSLEIYGNGDGKVDLLKDDIKKVYFKYLAASVGSVLITTVGMGKNRDVW